MPTIPSNRTAPLASDIAVQDALPLIGSLVRQQLKDILSTIDSDLAKLFEDRNILLVDGGEITYNGADVSFTEPLRLSINSQVAGGAPTVIDLGATTRNVSASGRMIYAVIDRSLGTAVITDDATTLPSVVAANIEVFLIAKRVDAGDGTKRLYFRNGMAMDEGQTARLGASGSGSGAGKFVHDLLTGVTGTSLTFSKLYPRNKETIFFRNGAKMRRVDSFTVGLENYADEYMEVGAGLTSTQINLHPDFGAETDDVFEFYYIQGIFNDQFLAEKEVKIARGFADGTQEQNCVITTNANKTRVTLSTFSYATAINPGFTKGDITVRVNGQDIERKVTGVNDNVGNIVYEEVAGNIVDIYEIIAGPGTQELALNTQVEVEKITFFVSDLNAIRSHLIPDENETYDLGSNLLKWRDLYIAGTSIHIGDGTIRRNPTSKQLEYKKDSTSAFLPLVGGNDSSSPSSLIDIIEKDEADTLTPLFPDEFIDDFSDEQKGTKVNVSQSLSHLRLNSGQNSGTYERTLETSAELRKANGLSKIRLIACGIKNNSVTQTQMVVPGDVSDIFVSTKKILIYKVVTSDGKLRHIHIFDNNNLLKSFTVTGVVYSSINDETTITVDNPGPTPYDLTLGVSGSEFFDKLRISPYEHKFEVRSKSTSPYEALDVTNILGLTSVALSGETAGAFFTELGNLTGSVIKSDAVMSKNKQYGVVRLVEQASPNAIQHWFYTSNSGVNWTKFTTTKSIGSPASNDFTGNWAILNRSQNAVANNGKFFGTYLYRNGANVDSVGGVYADLSTSPTTLTDTPATGADASNDNNVPGSIASNPSVPVYGSVAYDEEDLSFIAVGIRGDNNTLRIRWYSNGGATHLGLNSASLDHTQHEVQYTAVIGTGASHRTVVFYRSFANGALVYAYYDQGTLTPIGSGNVVSTSDPNPIIDGHCDQSSAKVAILYRNQTAGSQSVRYVTGTLSGTPSFSLTKHITNLMLADLYNGWSSTSVINWWKTYGTRILIDPSDTNHILMCVDYFDPDSYSRARFIEVKNDSAFLGTQISQVVTNTSNGLRESSSQQMIGQTFTASSTRVRTVSVRAYQKGTIPSGHTIKCSIYNTSGGFPTTLIADSINTYDPSKIHRGVFLADAQWLHFIFDDTAVESLTGTYAFVLSATYPIDSNNNVHIHGNGSEPYAGGQGVYYNGTSWTAPGTDYGFEINGEWMQHIGVAEHATVSHSNYGIQDQESGLSFIDNSRIQFVTRRTPTRGDAYKPITGQPYRRIITLNAGNRATISNATAFGNQFFDSKLVYSVAMGTDVCAGQDTTTGVIDNTRKTNDRSGFSQFINSIDPGIGAGNFVADASFESGFCMDFNGSSNYFALGNSSTLHFYYDRPFIIEMELKPDNVATQGFLLSDGGNGAQAGVSLLIGNAGGNGNVLVQLHNSAGATIANAQTVNGFLSNGVYNVLRISYDGSGGQIRIYKASSPSGVFTEAAYQGTPVNFSSGVSNPTQDHYVGRAVSGGSFYDGKIGYYKISNGANVFSYTGFKNQAPLTQVQNLGVCALAESRVGTNLTTNGTNFDNGGIIRVSSGGIVDSYDQYFLLEKNLENPTGKQIQLKVTLARNGSRDVSSLDNVYIRYTK